jgi:hypothetical protein
MENEDGGEGDGEQADVRFEFCAERGEVSESSILARRGWKVKWKAKKVKGIVILGEAGSEHVPSSKCFMGAVLGPGADSGGRQSQSVCTHAWGIVPRNSP